MPWACIAYVNNSVVAENHKRLQEPLEIFRFNIYAIVLPILMTIGILGNTMNLIILTRRRLRGKMHVMEQSATAGLAFLSLSEVLLCVVLLPYPYFYYHAVSKGGAVMRTLAVYYNSYHGILLNIFLFTCTWVTMVISIERYIAVCHVFKALSFIKLRRTIIIYVIVLLCGIGFSMIELVSKQVTWRYDLPMGSRVCEKAVFIFENYAVREAVPYKVYLISRSVLAILIPSLVLAYCNIRIVVTIARRNTSHLQEGTNRPRPQAKTTTIILIVMVLLFYILVFPNLIYHILSSLNLVPKTSMPVPQVILNLCQAINFSISFLLYCTMSREFRQTALSVIKHCLPCSLFRPYRPLDSNGSVSTNNSTRQYELVTNTTTFATEDDVANPDSQDGSPKTRILPTIA